MTFTALLGDDAVCARQLQQLLQQHAGNQIERLDATLHPLGEIVSVILAQSLFSPAQVIVIDQFDKLSVAQIETVSVAASDTEHTIYVIAKTLTAPQRKAVTAALGERFRTREFSALDGKRGGETLEMLAENAGVTLSRQVRQLLIERVGHDPARLLSVLEQCSIGNFTTPSSAQINLLCGTANAAGVPWDLSDSLERGDAAGAMAACSDAAPLATLAYLGNRYLQVMRIIEAGCKTTEEAVKASGAKSPATAERLMNLGRRIGREPLSEIITAIAEGDMLAKQHGVDGLRIVIGRIAPLFGMARSTSRTNTAAH